MKYARKHDYGSETRLIDVVEIPDPLPPWAQDVSAFLTKMFPGYTGWFLLEQDVGNGAVEQLDGTFEQPAIPAPVEPLKALVLTPGEVLDLLPAATVKALEDSASAAIKKRYAVFKLTPQWTQAQGEALFDDLVAAALISQEDADLIEWPTG